MKIIEINKNRVLSSCNMEFLGQSNKEIQDVMLRELPSSSWVKYFYRKQAILVRKL